MTWDWKKLLQGKDAPPEETSPLSGPEPGSQREALATGDSGGPDSQAVSHRQAPRPVAQVQANPPGGAEPTTGLVWHPTQMAGGTGRPTRKGRVPELLYGNEHDCAFCRGTGLMKGDNQCPVCRGRGKVSLPAPVVRCGFCHGGGHMPLGSTVTCPVCRGRGVIAVTLPIEICPHCNGRGRQRGHSLYCGLCRGSGVVTSPKPDELAAGAAGLSVERLGVADRRSAVA